MEEFRPGFINELVADDGLDGLASAGNPLDDTVCFVRTFSYIQQRQFAHPRDTMIAGYNGHNLAGRTGNPSWKVERVWPIGVTSIHRPLACTVRIHYHQRP